MADFCSKTLVAAKCVVGITLCGLKFAEQTALLKQPLNALDIPTAYIGALIRIRCYMLEDQIAGRIFLTR